MAGSRGNALVPSWLTEAKGTPADALAPGPAPVTKRFLKKLQHSLRDFRKAPLPLVLVRLWAGAGFREGRVTPHVESRERPHLPGQSLG